MKEFKGTKGPWDINRFGVTITSVKTEGRTICVSRVNNLFESNANMKLIANAPKMLKMLQDLVYEFEIDSLSAALSDKMKDAKHLLNKILD